VAVALAVALGTGCGLIRQSALLPENQMPPPPPVTYSQFHLPGWDWAAVRRVVVLSPRNESAYTRAGREFQQALASELQRLGRFEVVTAPFDDQTRMASLIHQGGKFNEAVAAAIAREHRADLLMYATVTQYSPYPRPRMGVVVQAVSPGEGKVAASVDGVWDTTDGGLAEQVRAYYRQRPKPLPVHVRNHTIVADDNFAGDIALDSPALFQRYVAHLVSETLVYGGDEVILTGATGGNAGTGADCKPAGPVKKLLRR
jgi:hypothetical protein